MLHRPGEKYVIFCKSRNNKQRKKTFVQISINILRAAISLSTLKIHLKNGIFSDDFRQKLYQSEKLK